MKKSVYVFGRGRYCKEKLGFLEDDFHFLGFLDNSIPYGEILDMETGVPAMHPEMMKGHKEISVLIMVSMKYLIEVVNQLFSYGVQEDQLYIGLNYSPACIPIERYLEKNDIKIILKEKRFYIKKNNKCHEFKDLSSAYRVMKEEDGDLSELSGLVRKLPLNPHSRFFGSEMGGKPIDRYYIEAFLEQNKESIRGTVMEVADDLYTKRYGVDVKKSIVTHVYGEGVDVRKLDLATGEGVEDSMADCFICTQTIQMIYDTSMAMKNIHRLLKPGGTALITMHANSQLSENDQSRWGEYWRFTKQSAKILATNAGFSDASIQVQTFGNVKVLTAFFYGLSMEDMDMCDYNYNDEQYPLIITMKVQKN